MSIKVIVHSHLNGGIVLVILFSLCQFSGRTSFSSGRCDDPELLPDSMGADHGSS